MNTITELKTVCLRNQATLMQDSLGAAALGVMLIVALHLPSLL